LKKQFVVSVVVALLFLPVTAQAAACTQQLMQDYNTCSNLEGFWTRSACGLDAEITYAGCVGREIAPWR
jgi:hypothetical protein